MKDQRKAKVIETKRKPPIWSVKAGACYVTSFMGNDARKQAIAYATKNFAEFEIVEKPAPIHTSKGTASIPSSRGLAIKFFLYHLQQLQTMLQNMRR